MTDVVKNASQFNKLIARLMPPLSAFCAECKKHVSMSVFKQLSPSFVVEFRSDDDFFHTIWVAESADGSIEILQTNDLPGTQPTPRKRSFDGRMIDLVQALNNIVSGHDVIENFAVITAVELPNAPQRIQILVLTLQCFDCILQSVAKKMASL